MGDSHMRGYASRARVRRLAEHHPPRRHEDPMRTVDECRDATRLAEPVRRAGRGRPTGASTRYTHGQVLGAGPAGPACAAGASTRRRAR